MLGMLAAMGAEGTFVKGPDWRCKQLIEPIPCGEGGTLIANGGDRNPPSREGQQPQAIHHPLCCLLPFSQTLWFDLHQRLSDSESTACTVSVPDHHRGCWGAPAAQSHIWGHCVPLGLTCRVWGPCSTCSW